ncbi:hypothetical protein M408DRAFT_30644 [Serendipita vermifera MAFF 305830]|uniref:C2H2-type domain-containing protein n=1 Tax=Serendipita vermifera MAFF 305830 TaxID=933852 RepID=A0A0C3AJ96_SERVB|nr:hypothetical protein M408DRAFT_30644 [Serendipita vermifera MAFF 305830]
MYHINEGFYLTEADSHASTGDFVHTSELFLPLQELALTTIPSKWVNPPCSGALDDAFEPSLSPINLGNELGEQQPVLATEVWSHPSATHGAFSIPARQDIIDYTSKVELYINPTSVFSAGLAATVTRDVTGVTLSTPVANTLLSPSGSHKASLRRYICIVCPRTFDRIQRARDCANRDLGMEPYVCGDTRIGTIDPKSTPTLYSSSRGVTPSTMPNEVTFPWGDSPDNDLGFVLSIVSLADEEGVQRPALAREAQANSLAIRNAVNTANGGNPTRYMFQNEAVIEPASIFGVHFPSAVVAEGAIVSPIANTTPLPSGFHVHGQKRYSCAFCPRSFDRIQRAGDCANKDLGLAPYVCGNRCQKLNCTKAYTSEVLLLEHLAPIEKRVRQCSRCGRSVLRKNMARHRLQGACLANAQVP